MILPFFFFFWSRICFTSVVLHRNIPSTFNASVGKVVHKLKAELKQPMRPTKRAKTHFRFQSKPNLDLPGLMVRNLCFGRVSAELEQPSRADT